jgi:PAS domain-containing protein
MRMTIKSGIMGNGDVFLRIAENAPDIFYHFRFKPAFACVYINPAVEKLLGYTPQDFYSNPRLWVRILYPEDRALLQVRFVPQKMSWPVELRLIRKDGSILWTTRGRWWRWGGWSMISPNASASRSI